MKNFLITLFGGAFGVHKFLAGKWGLGILYLFTGGLFGIGWLVDTILAAKQLSESTAISSCNYSTVTNSYVSSITKETEKSSFIKSPTSSVSSKPKKKGSCLKSIIIFIIVIWILSFFANVDNPSETVPATDESSATNSEEIVTQEDKTSELTPKELFSEALTSNSDVSAEAANSTYDILTNELGFENVSVTKNPSGTLFEIAADDYSLKITVSDKLYMVICGDYNLYKDDTVNYTKQDLEDRVIGNNDTYYYVIAQEIVSNNLKAPSSAVFCSINNCNMVRNKDYVAVQGYVDASNSFGAQIRTEFIVEFKVLDLTNFSYETVYINLDGETAGTYVDLT